MCGIPWVNCIVLCVKDDSKGQFWGLRYCLSKLRSYSVFPSGMTYWKCSRIIGTVWVMGETTERPSRNALYSCPSLLYVELRKILTLQGDVNSSSPDGRFSAIDMWLMFSYLRRVPVPVAARSKAWVCGRWPAEIVGSNPTGGMDVCRECCVLSGRSLCDKLITNPGESYRPWCVFVCDLEISWMRRPWPTGGCCTKSKQTYEE